MLLARVLPCPTGSEVWIPKSGNPLDLEENGHQCRRQGDRDVVTRGESVVQKRAYLKSQLRLERA